MIQTVTPVATPPVIRALLDQAREKNYRAGVLGVRARPEWDGPSEFEHDGVPVRVAPCSSALAVREAMLGRDAHRWLVVLTDRDEADLGYGLLGRFIWHRLRTPDPWDAVRQRFAASGIDPALTTEEQHRDVATGLLAATPPNGWPPAPGGVLTRDHALGAAARAHLGLGADNLDVDAPAVLGWSTRPDTATRIADLRTLAGDAMCDAVLRWVAGRAGGSRGPLERLLAAGAGTDAVPLGLVSGLLVAARHGAGDSGGDSAQTARDALIRLEHTLGPAARDIPALAAWGAEAEAVAADLLHHDDAATAGKQVVARADALLRTLAADPLAAASDLLPAGLATRLARLAAALRTAAGHAESRAAGGVDVALVDEADLAAVEAAWDHAVAHRLGDTDRRMSPSHAAVRLVRWLATDTTAKRGLAAAVARHRDADAWADSAVADTWAGVGDPDLGSALSAVLAVVRRRRDDHDRAFAAALAAHTRDDPAAELGPSGRGYRGVRHLEDLLPDVVVPLARKAPVLLLVMDGMSVAVAAEVMAKVLGRVADGWVEALLHGERRRAAALAVLPTLTEVSRASLLCGELRVGQQAEEARGYPELVRAHGLPHPTLFHKAPLDTSQPGHDLAADVAAAIDDLERRPLVTCVLNAIDDTLDRSDPGGTDWGPEAVKHLEPLLDRARRAGRTVVLTADHGHVIERRAGTQRPYPEISSGRSRPGDGPPPGDGEVLVSGRRVLRHDGRAVLAVDERLRYGPLKAGYHGGASPAEAVVPCCVLVPGAIPDGTDLRLAGPQEPDWWAARPDSTAATQPTSGPPPPAAEATPAAPVLFEVGEARPQAGPPVESSAEATAEGSDADTVADAVLRSTPYRAQRRIAGRVAVTDTQVRDLLVALLTAADHRLSSRGVAAALQLPTLGVRGALAHVFRLVNVEGYPVVGFDADGATVVLDEALLREQFGVAT